jgi:hypothetical protein
MSKYIIEYCNSPKAWQLMKKQKLKKKIILRIIRNILIFICLIGLMTWCSTETIKYNKRIKKELEYNYNHRQDTIKNITIYIDAGSPNLKQNVIRIYPGYRILNKKVIGSTNERHLIDPDQHEIYYELILVRDDE